MSEQSKRALHNLGATPRKSVIHSDQWIKPDEPQRPRTSPRSSDVLRTAPGQQHWVVEEAERRRLAEQTGKERLQKLQSRQQQGQSPYEQYRQEGYNRSSPYTGEGMGGVVSNSSVSPRLQYPYGGGDTSHDASRMYNPDTITPTNQSLSQQPPPPSSLSSLPSSSSNYYHNNQHNQPTHQQPLLTQQQQQQPLNQTLPHQSYPYQPVPAPAASYPEYSHQRTGSDASSEHRAAPPVPPKPSRGLLSSSTSSDDEHRAAAEQVTVSGYQQCAHCETELGKQCEPAK